MSNSEIIKISESLCIRIKKEPSLAVKLNSDFIVSALLRKVCQGISEGNPIEIPDDVEDRYPSETTEQLIMLHNNFVANNSLLNKLDKLKEEIKGKMLVNPPDLSISALPYHKRLPMSVKDKKKEMIKSGRKFEGIKTGYADLDHIIGTVLNGSLIIIGARPGAGKTTLALNMAMTNAVKYPEKNVFFLSLEMSAELLITKIDCIDNRKSLRKGLSDPLNNDELHGNFYIAEYGGVEDIEEFLKEYPCSAVFVDYIQYMTGDSSGDSVGRYNDVSDNVIKLKKLAVKYNVPVFALSQLTRSVEHRQDKKLTMSDLRDSGYIEQTADLIILMSPDNRKNNLVNIQIEKNRYGQTGRTCLIFDKEYGTFASMKRIGNNCPFDYPRVPD